jgi:hypothetical protein
MYPYFRLKVGRMRLCAFIILLIFLMGCGPSSSPRGESGRTSVPRSTPTPTLTVTEVPSPTPSPTPTPSLESSLHNAPISADVPVPGNVHGLHFYSVEGLQCPIRRIPREPNPQGGMFLEPSDDLVLATERLTYSEDEIQQMRNYLNEIFSNAASITTSYLVPPPSTLRWVPGASRCTLTLQVSNIGTTTVQISSLGVQLTSTPQPNNYQYHGAVDACSIGGQQIMASTNCQGFSGAGDCSTYVASVNLDPSAPSKTVFTGTPLQGASEAGPCLEPTLHPGETLYFTLDLSSPGPQQYSVAPYIYSVMPLLTVNDASVSITSTLPLMAATIAFARQIPCYGLQHDQDTTLTLITSSNGCLG